MAGDREVYRPATVMGKDYEDKQQPKGLITPIYTFSGPDGWNPQARVIVGPDGTLYGTTTYGGTADEGTVFNLRPPAAACKTALCLWTETVLYSFQGFTDGVEPTFGDLAFDAAGNIYGTTPHGGQGDNGTVYKLIRSNGGWTETVLYRFQGGQDGAYPYAGLVFDQAGNLWGATGFGGGYDNGTIYELVPSGGGWAESVVYHFLGGSDGANPYNGLIADQFGNFYGGTFGYNGTAPKVYELSPSNDGWTFNTLYSFWPRSRHHREPGHGCRRQPLRDDVQRFPGGFPADTFERRLDVDGL